MLLDLAKPAPTGTDLATSDLGKAGLAGSPRAPASGRPELAPSAAPEPASLRPAGDGAQGMAIGLRDLRKDFDGHPVIEGIDLHVPAGQFVAVVGRSGCGKSTLLRLILGLERPSGGRIETQEAGALSRRGGRPKRIMFQEPRLLPWARVVDNVAIGLGQGGSRAERRALAQAALDQVGLADKAESWPATLSGGQRQRVALARALVSGPALLALDEPLGALDALTRIGMQDLIERIWLAQGFTAFLVTHDVAEAAALADRILVVDEGRVALDLRVEVPRPRRRGDPRLAALEGRILEFLLRERAA